MKNLEHNSSAKGKIVEFYDGTMSVQVDDDAPEEDGITKFLYFMSDINRGLIVSIAVMVGMLYVGSHYFNWLVLPSLIFDALYGILLIAVSQTIREKSSKREIYV